MDPDDGHPGGGLSLSSPTSTTRSPRTRSRAPRPPNDARRDRPRSSRPSPAGGARRAAPWARGARGAADGIREPSPRRAADRPRPARLHRNVLAEVTAPAQAADPRAEQPTASAPRSTSFAYLGLAPTWVTRRANLQAAVDLLPRYGVRVPGQLVDVRHRSRRRDPRPAGVPEMPACGWRRACAARVARCLQGRRAGAGEGAGRRAGLREAWARGARRGSAPLRRSALAVDRLTLPHPQVLARRFVLVPLLELTSRCALPQATHSSDALAQLPLDEGVRRDARRSPSQLGPRAARPAPGLRPPPYRTRDFAVVAPACANRYSSAVASPLPPARSDVPVPPPLDAPACSRGRRGRRPRARCRVRVRASARVSAGGGVGVDERTQIVDGAQQLHDAPIWRSAAVGS